MPMDPQLAAIYGTDGGESDVEKLAAAELAEKLAEDGDADLEGLTAEQAEELAQQVLAAGDESEEEVAEEPTEEEEITEPTEKTSAAEETEETEETDEAQEKLAEADYLGRVMAHAYTQELRKIASGEEDLEKEAGEKWNKFKGKAKDTAEKAWAGTKGAPGKAWGAVKRNPKTSAGVGAGLLAAGGAAAAYKHSKGKKKKAAAEEQVEQEQMSALDTLAVARAEEILAAAQEQEKTSASETEMAQLQAAVDARAMEMLVDIMARECNKLLRM